MTLNRRPWRNAIVHLLLTAIVDVDLPGEHHGRVLDGCERFAGCAAS